MSGPVLAMRLGKMKGESNERGRDMKAPVWFRRAVTARRENQQGMRHETRDAIVRKDVRLREGRVSSDESGGRST